MQTGHQMVFPTGFFRSLFLVISLRRGRDASWLHRREANTARAFYVSLDLVHHRPLSLLGDYGGLASHMSMSDITGML